MSPADLILRHGRIHTLHPGQPPQQALAIRGDRVAAVGDDAEIWRWNGPATTVLDLRGRAAFPGFIDAHVHLAGFARLLRRVDLAGVASLREALARIADRAARLPEGAWVLGGGWNHNLWPEGRFPRREDADAVAGGRPLALHSKDGHVLWANSAALALAGVGRETPDPAGGEIERDATGEPTGLLKETAAGLVSRVIPETGVDETAALLAEALALVQSYGLTGVHSNEGATALGALQELRSEGRLGLRVCASLPAGSLDEALALGLRTGWGDEWLRLGGVKVFCDGALGARTAHMLEPYEGAPGQCGIEVTDAAALAELARRAAAGGLALAIHAIGDRANRQALDALEAAIRSGAGRGLRHRVEHVQTLHPADIPRFGALGVIASMQPIHATSDMAMADRHLGARARWSYAWRSLAASGATLAFGSDAPVESMEPLRGIHAAVTRQRPDGSPAGGWYPEERLTAAEAVAAYTLGAAYASGEESLKGSLVPGKLADVVVLSQDLLAIPPSEILSTRVEHTSLGGQVVYSA